MYLSYLLVDVGTNPDRPRPGRLWLRNLYHVHQRLCMAFPSDPRKKRDPQFLAPYAPEDFPEQRHLANKGKSEIDPTLLKQVHSPRDSDCGFLFRIDPQPGGRVVILVQSAAKPDWDYAFGLKVGLLDEQGRPIGNAGYLLAAPPQVKSFDPSFEAGQHLRFRLLANPTKKIDTISKEARQRYTEEELRQIKGRHGRRVPVPSAEELAAWRNQNPNADARVFICSELLGWLLDWRCRRDGRDEPSGFCIDKDRTTVQPGYIYVDKARNGARYRLRSVRYDGTLTVTDPARFREAMREGIGPGKAFGFGLLSVL